MPEYSEVGDRSRTVVAISTQLSLNQYVNNHTDSISYAIYSLPFFYYVPQRAVVSKLCTGEYCSKLIGAWKDVHHHLFFWFSQVPPSWIVQDLGQPKTAACKRARKKRLLQKKGSVITVSLGTAAKGKPLYYSQAATHPGT